MSWSPIGYFSSSNAFKAEAPRQGVLSEAEGVVHLEKQKNFEQALIGLDGFQRIWLIYSFHLNDHWKPMLRPQSIETKIGVFASRSPYRPNSIGMSCVRLIKVDGLRLHVTEHDLLNGTPIFDIKPYLSYADSFSEQEALTENCWWKSQKKYNLSYCELVEKQMTWLHNQTQVNFKNILMSQLTYAPTDSSRKRVSRSSDEMFWVLAFRTWRVFFLIDEAEYQVSVQRISSVYSQLDLVPKQSEFHGLENSPAVHRQFMSDFGCELRFG